MLLGPVHATGTFDGVDALFANPPESTEQVLHPEKLSSREAPVAVAFPDDLAARLGDGWCVALQDTFGEFQLRILLADAAGVDAGGGGRGGRVGRRPGRVGRRARTAPRGVVLDTALGHGRRRERVRDGPRGIVPRLQAAGRSAQVLTPEPNRVVLISANSDDTLGRSRTSSASRADVRVAARRDPPPRLLHRLGRRDPEQPQGVRERRLRCQRQREPLGRALRLRRVDHPRVAIEGVELGRELGRVGGDPLRLLRRRPRPRRPRESAPRRARGAASGSPPSSPSTSPAGARPTSAALRRIEAIRACAYCT